MAMICQPWLTTGENMIGLLSAPRPQTDSGMIDEEGKVIAAGDGPSSPKARRDSLTALIGAGPLASTALDGANDMEEAMQKT